MLIIQKTTRRFYEVMMKCVVVHPRNHTGVVCVCLCCLRACAYVHTGKLACVPYTSGGQRFMFQGLSQSLATLCLETRGLLLDLELTISARSTTGQ